MSAHMHGLRIWLLQRISALYMAVYLIVAFSWLYSVPTVDFLTWQGVFASPLSNILSQIFIYMLLAHAWIGIRDILIDYVHHLPTRLVLILALTFLQLILAIWVFMSFYAVVKL